ncbi:MAG: hypothetical protein OXI25_02195 [Chloroflexota bacterium]|nr:hypothetical protein [Chloroflexota bacterium]
MQIIGVENAPNAVAMRINITDEGWGWTDTILAQSEDGHSCFSAAGGRVLEGDIIAFVGITAGEYTYAAVLGNSITLPAAVCLRPADIPTAMPQMPPIVGFGESFNTDGFELTIGAPEAYHPGNSFSDVTHRVKVRLRNTADQTNEFFGGNVGAVVGGQVLDPDYCFDCPSNLVSFTEFISGAETTGYLYYTDEPEEIRVKSGLFGDEEIVVR